jgi:hypothetical protein
MTKKNDTTTAIQPPKLPRVPHGPRVDVNVTKPIMDLSKGRNSSHCMIAEALRDARPDAASISVDLQTIRFSLPNRRLRYTYLTPRIAQLALIKFDQGQMPEPFSFSLKGAHVTSMFRRVVVATPRSTRPPDRPGYYDDDAGCWSGKPQDAALLMHYLRRRSTTGLPVTAAESAALLR